MAKLSFVVPGTPLAKKRHRTVPMSQCMTCRKMVHGNYHECPDCNQSLRFIKNASYPDSESVRYENLVAMCARQEMLKQKVENPFSGAIRIEATFTFPIPATRQCSKVEHTAKYHADQHPHFPNLAIDAIHAARNGCKKLHPGNHHAQRPDVDNLTKSILDGLNTVLFADDCLISKIAATKTWGSAGQAVVTVEEL